jgi:hypothetical protein
MRDVGLAIEGGRLSDEQEDVVDFGDGSFAITGSTKSGREKAHPEVRRPVGKSIAIAITIVIVLTSAGAASAQYFRDAVQGFYGGMGAYGGALCCGPGGAVVGGAGGAAVGGWVYDTHRNFLRQLPRNEPVYPPQQWRHGGSTPMYLQRRY